MPKPIQPLNLDLSEYSDFEQTWYRKLGDKLGIPPGVVASHHIGMYLLRDVRGKDVDYSETFPNETPENRQILNRILASVIEGDDFPDI